MSKSFEQSNDTNKFKLILTLDSIDVTDNATFNGLKVNPNNLYVLDSNSKITLNLQNGDSFSIGHSCLPPVKYFISDDDDCILYMNFYSSYLGSNIFDEKEFKYLVLIESNCLGVEWIILEPL
ncbi:MAG: hypothetical protein R3A43_04835 [Bacteroidia bacterium]